LPVHPPCSRVGNGTLKVDDTDKGYTGGPKEREWLCYITNTNLPRCCN